MGQSKILIRLLSCLPVILILLFAIPGCTEDPAENEPVLDPGASKVKSDSAYLLMETQFDLLVNGDIQSSTDLDKIRFDKANKYYKDAIILNPDNLEAQFGAALTEILLAYSDTDINALIKQMEDSDLNKGTFSQLLSRPVIPVSSGNMNIPTSLVASNAFMIMSKSLQDPPLISKIQQVLRDRFMPRISYAIACLTKIESNQNFKFTVSPKMQGHSSGKSYSLYVTEVYLTNALLHGVYSAMNVFLMYNFDLPNYSQTSIVNAIRQDNQTFFVLAPDGRQKAQESKNALLTMIDKIKAGIGSLETVSGSKPDAVIKMGQDGIKKSDLDTVKKYLDKVKLTLTTPVSIYIEDGDTDHKSYTVTVNIGQFFDNPVENPKKTLFPAYSVSTAGPEVEDIRLEFVAKTYNQFTFPDPTIGGILPGMTNETLKRLLYIDEEFAYRIWGSVYYESSNWSGGIYPKGTVKLITQGGKTYIIPIGEYGEFRFFLRDATETADEITGFYVDFGEGYVEMENADPNRKFYVKVKQYDWFNFQITRQPEGLAAERISPNSIQLSWKVAGGTDGGYNYKLQRKLKSETEFTDIAGASFNYQYTDYNAPTGSIYQYRVRTTKPDYMWYGSFCRKDILYSNVVEI